MGGCFSCFSRYASIPVALTHWRVIVALRIAYRGSNNHRAHRRVTYVQRCSEGTVRLLLFNNNGHDQKRTVLRATRGLMLRCLPLIL